MATSRKTSLASYSHQIASHARAIRIATANILPSTVVRQDVADAQEVTANVFPSPPSILSDIVALGLRPFAARTISMAYQRSALDFKARAEASHTLALQQLRQIPTGNASGPSKPNPLFTRAIITNYLKALEKWRQSIIGKVSQRIRELRDAHTPASEKKGFNVSAIPILEDFFAQNARPSRAEKKQLAVQTTMEYKQISIWFQNRRNRAKRKVSEASESPTLTTLGGEADPLPPDLAAALARILAQYVTTEDTTVPDEQSDLVRYVLSFRPFHVDRPEYAFPMSYPPLYSHEPFPLSGDARQFPTPWLRTSVGSSPSARASNESEVLILLERWSLESEERLQNTVADGTPGTDSPPKCMLALFHSESTICSCATCTSTSPPSSWTRLQASKIEDHLAGASRNHTVSPSYIRGPRRRRKAQFDTSLVTPSTATRITSTSSGGAPDTLASRLIGRPYPRGKPSRGTVMRNMPRIRRRGYVCAYPSSSPACAQSPRQTTQSSPPIVLPTLSRESSVASSRSVSARSDTSSESELLLTPPLFPTSVLDYPVPDSPAFDLSLHKDDVSYKRLTVGATPRAAYLGYSLVCGDRDPKAELASTLYSQLDSAIRLYNPLVLAG